MLKRVVILMAAGSLLGGWLVACGSQADDMGGGCTLASCGSGVFVRADGLPQEAKSITLCKDSRCVTEQIRQNKTAATVSVRCSPKPATVRASVTVSGSGGRVMGRASRVIALKRKQPNGPDCPPTCWAAELHYSGVRNDLRPHQY